MSSINVLTLSGNIGREPEMSYTQSGIAVTRFSIAVDEWNSSTKARETMWVDCVAFRDLAERIAQWTQSGTAVIVVGKLKISKYTRKDGSSGMSTSCLVNTLEITARGRKKSEEQIPVAESPACDPSELDEDILQPF